MRIVQVTPGVMPIPPKGWGAVEKIIWEYKKQLEFLGYETDILYADEITDSKDQIVHVHMANLAHILHSRGIEYVFSLHDHHVEHFGKGSECYNSNYEAIKNSKLTFVHSPHLIEYFDSIPNIVYLQHGANLKDYEFFDRSTHIRSETKLLMMANNGIGGDPLTDRKGFLLGVEAAKSLGIDITIMCPSSNKEFFAHHDISYERLMVLYDMDYEQSLNEIKKHNIFLNPSMLEAGHPNLTVTESVASGLPVVGTSYVDLPGLVRCERSVEDISRAISKCVASYDTLTEEMRSKRYLVSWDIVVTKMLQWYKRSFSISEKAQLEHQYSKTKKSHKPKQEKSGVAVEFKNGKAFIKTSLFSEGLTAVFRDNRTNKVLFESHLGKTPGQWAYIWAPSDQFVDWEVSLYYGAVSVHTEKLELFGKKVLVTGQVDPKQVLEFTNATGALLTLKDTYLPQFCYDPDAQGDTFYTTYNGTQVSDFFTQKPRVPDRYLLRMESKALGDTIGFVPYAQEWAEKNGLHVDVAVTRADIFDISSYPNINLIESSEVRDGEYNRVYRFEYQFDESLQKGYSDQLGLEFREIPPKIRKSGLERPLGKKYAVLGVQTTTQCKYWNYPGGWEKICKGLKSKGIQPVAVDRFESYGIDGYWNVLPESAMKKVGMDFNEVIRWIEHCEVFIGVSSGLSWLAYGLGKKVVMITGTTEEGNEFEINNTLVSNRKVCNGCFNRPHLHRFDAGDWLWCPINRGTKKQFECTKTITPEMVMDAIKENL